jgi:hypothetical protein
MQQSARPDGPVRSESFPTDPSGLPEAGRPALLELADGETLELQVGPVAKRLGQGGAASRPTGRSTMTPDRA